MIHSCLCRRFWSARPKFTQHAFAIDHISQPPHLLQHVSPRTFDDRPVFFDRLSQRLKRIFAISGWSVGGFKTSALLIALLFCGSVQAAASNPASGTKSIDPENVNASLCARVATDPVFPIPKDVTLLPELRERVTDTAGALSEACKSDLTDRLAKFENETGVQLAVLVVATTGQESIEQFATAIFDKWKLGNKETNNGILLVTVLNDHRARIEVGYGLEGAIPDVVAADIIRKNIIPAFRSGNVEAGVSSAVNALVARLIPSATKASVDETTAPINAFNGSGQTVGFSFSLLLLIANLILGVVFKWRKIRWQVAVPSSYLGTSALIIAGLMPGPVFDAGYGWTGMRVILLPAVFGLPALLFGMRLASSPSVRKYTAIGGGILCLLLAMGHAMGASVKDTLILIVILVGAVALLVIAIAGQLGLLGSGFSSSSSRSSSRSSSSSSSNDFSGGGGSSGGGGASDRW